MDQSDIRDEFRRDWHVGDFCEYLLSSFCPIDS